MFTLINPVAVILIYFLPILYLASTYMPQKLYAIIRMDVYVKSRWEYSFNFRLLAFFPEMDSIFFPLLLWSPDVGR